MNDLEKLSKLHKELEQKMADKKHLVATTKALHEQTKLLKKQRAELMEHLWKEVEVPIAQLGDALDMTPDEAYAFIYQMSWFLPRKDIKNA